MAWKCPKCVNVNESNPCGCGFDLLAKEKVFNVTEEETMDDRVGGTADVQPHAAAGGKA